MSFAGKVWRLLVGIKDGLVLVFLLLFFAALYAALTVRPSPGQVREGALLLELDGSVVEERSPIDPFEILLSGTVPPGEYPARDLVRAIDAAANDDRIKAIVLDLSRFLGGGQVHLQEIGAALDRARAADKPVFAFATAYVDDGMMLAAHASEVWVDPLGGVVISGPGGDRLYFSRLLDRLSIKAHVFRVGTHKAAVEPFTRSDMSPEARENATALYGALWDEWLANVRTARPGAKLTRVTQSPGEWFEEAGGDGAKAAQQAGLVDKIGDRISFGRRVATIAGADPWTNRPGTFAHTELEPWLADNEPKKRGSKIGVVTIAGEIVDGDAGPGTAGGDRISDLLDKALEDELAALVVRVDSPGGSVLASEEIRRAILRHKARGIPVAVSMANVAASGGYWVSTPADRIFAEPETITGSIGVFAIIPTFEGLLGDWGVTGDGVHTTPLSGQPNLATGLTPEVSDMAQAYIEHSYARFLALVAKSRGKPPSEINAVAQGRVWDGGAARQLGLVDEYGGLDRALDWAAKEAGLEGGKWHAEFFGEDQDPYASLIQEIFRGEKNSGGAHDLLALMAKRHEASALGLARDLERLVNTAGAQAYCLECIQAPLWGHTKGDLGLLARIAVLLKQ